MKSEKLVENRGYGLGDRVPQVHKDAFIAHSADVLGSVTLHKGASVFFNSVLRGDNEMITIGEDSNIQDLSMLHTDPAYPTTVGARVTVGHRVILHGCSLEDECLIGMGSIVLNGAKIQKHCLVGAGALVTEGKTFPERHLIVGSPAKAVRLLSDNEIQMIIGSAQHYVENATNLRKKLHF